MLQQRITLAAPDNHHNMWSVFAVGDLYAASHPTIEPELNHTIQECDIALVNMEAPLRTENALPLPKAGVCLQMDTDIPHAIREMGFDVVSLANNHAMDFGALALRHTIDRCRAVGLRVVGAGQDRQAAHTPVSMTIQGCRVAVLAFCEQEFGIAGDATPGTAWISHPAVLNDVTQAASQSDVTIVLAHGGAEVVPIPSPRRQRQLRALIDAGAAIVIGHHPHVAQSWERYNDGIIFYSLGNFLFDLPTTVTGQQWGLAIKANFSGSKLLDVELLLTEQTSKGAVRPIEHTQPYLQYLHRCTQVIADEESLISSWQSTALELWQSRYWPLIQTSLEARISVKTGLRYHLKGLLKSLLRRKSAAPVQSTVYQITDLYLLLVLLRNESHHEAIETALALLAGVEPRAEKTKDQFNALMQMLSR